MLNLRIYALGRPQSGHRLRTLTLNLSFFPIFSNLAFVDKAVSFTQSLKINYLRKGIPNSVNTARACSFVFAVVVIVIVIPLILSTRS